MENLLKIVDMKNYEKSWHVVKRFAIRGIIYNLSGKLAMIQSNQFGELRFPGGGMEKGETDAATLTREVAEEAGLEVLMNTMSYYGEVIERKKAIFEKDSIFEQHSRYYFCSVDETHIVSQKLEKYEKEMGFHLVWISCEEAMNQMEIIKKKLAADMDQMPWVFRDYFILSKLKDRKLKRSNGVESYQSNSRESEV